MFIENVLYLLVLVAPKERNDFALSAQPLIRAMCAAINIRLLRSRGLIKKLANQTLFFFILDARE